MANLNITRNYIQFKQFLLEAELDDIKDSIETFLNVTKLEDGNFQPSTLTGDKLQLNFVDNDSLVISSDKIAIAPLESTYFQSSGLLNINFASHSILNLDIPARTAGSTSLGQVLSTSLYSGSTSSSSFTPIAALSGSFYHSARPVRIMLVHVPSSIYSLGVAIENTSTTGVCGEYRFLKNGLAIDTRLFGSDYNHSFSTALLGPSNQIETVDFPTTTGTDVYSFEYRCVSATQVTMNDFKLVVFEE